MDKFSKSLKRHISLQSLSLNFEESEISGEGVTNLGEDLEIFDCLQSINLGFSKCRAITEESLLSLCQSFRMLDCLRVVDLNFQYCREITDYSVNTFGNRLKRLGSIQCISIVYGLSKSCYYEGGDSKQSEEHDSSAKSEEDSAKSDNSDFRREESDYADDSS